MNMLHSDNLDSEDLRSLDQLAKILRMILEYKLRAAQSAQENTVPLVNCNSKNMTKLTTNIMEWNKEITTSKVRL